MNILIDQSRIPTFQELEVQEIAGGRYVPLQQILDICQDRAILLMRQIASPDCPSESIGALQGRTQELIELLTVLSKQNG